MEAETAIIQLPVYDQDYIRALTANNIKQLYKQQFINKHHNSNNATHEYRILKKIKGKLRQ
jgi:hypothetical protein